MEAPKITFVPGMTYQELENLVFMVSHQAGTDSLTSLNVVITLEYDDEEAFSSFMDKFTANYKENVNYDGISIDIFSGRKLLCKYTGPDLNKKGLIFTGCNEEKNKEEISREHWMEEMKKAPLEPREKPKFFVLYDIDMIPEGTDFQVILDLFKTEGILLYNGDHGIPTVYDVSEGKAELIEIRNTVE